MSRKSTIRAKHAFTLLGPLLLDSYSVFKFDLVLTACMVPLQDFCSSSLWLTYPSPDPAKSPTMNFIPRFGSALVSFLLNKLQKINSKGRLESPRTSSWWCHLCLSDCCQVAFHDGKELDPGCFFCIAAWRGSTQECRAQRGLLRVVY